MKILDCESVDSTYRSLESIVGLQRTALDALFDHLNIEQLYSDNPHLAVPPDQVVLSKVAELAQSALAYDRVCWFHLTRVGSLQAFEQGILPLNQQIDSIWQYLFSLTGGMVSWEEWQAFRTNLGSSHSAWLYRMKTSTPTHWGPYAILVRDIAFKSGEVGNHDYLQVPEIIEDICRCFEEKHHFDLMRAFIENTRPCIVKFMSDGVREGCIPAALYYLYSTRRGYEYSLDCNSCFDGNGAAVPRERILNVEFPGATTIGTRDA